MNFFAVCGFCILCLYLGVMLKSYRSELALTVGLLGALTLGAYALSCLSPVAEFIKEKAAGTEAQNGVVLMLKALGVGFFSGLASDMCKDAGESALQTQMELCGKCLILTLCLPLVTELLSSVSQFLSF